MKTASRSSHAELPAISTPLCGLLNIRAPIIQAPIGSLTCPELAAAVSNAGALGTLAGTWRPADELRRLILATHGLTSRPFAVNLGVHLDPAEKLSICIEEKAPVVSLFWGEAAPFIPRLKAAGIIVLATVGSAAEAERAAEAGADAIVAQGWEAGGHVWGSVASMPLIPCVVDAVSPVPVVAAGGIADGRGIAAALVLGAAGAWLGTRFILSTEAFAHPEYRRLVIAAAETGTCHTSLFDHGWPGAPHRTLRNSTIEQWEKAGCPKSGSRPGEGEKAAEHPDGRPIMRYAFNAPAANVSGQPEAMALYAGQSAGLLESTRRAEEIVVKLVEETAAALRRASKLMMDLES